MHVCRLILYKFFWYKFLARNCIQLYSRTEILRHMTQAVQSDWPASSNIIFVFISFLAALVI